MPIKTDLNVNPYYDDYDPNKNYYKILFKPGVAVQVREINQLQTILQNQIEKFGDNIYKKGTIIAGCNFIFHNPIKYVKINDTEPDGTPINLSEFKGRFVKSVDNGLTARVMEIEDGYQTNSPDLKTLYLKYTNTGNNGEIEFDQDENLLFYKSGDSVEDIDVLNGSAGFSNDDIVVLTSAIAVTDRNRSQNFSNTFSVGETLITESGAKVKITEVDTTSTPYSTILKIKPLASQLRLGNTASWEFLKNEAFYTDTTAITGYISEIIGKGATASILTNQLGSVTTCVPIDNGVGYSIPPTVSVSFATPDSNANEGLIDALNIQAKNYKATVTVNEAIDSTGNAYGFSVGPGVIYQNGYFIRTPGSFVIVEKYSTDTDKVVGFDTLERIRTYVDDSTLYDNATGTQNETAPGADRLELTPTLVSITKDAAVANTDFFPIVEFSEGRPFKQNQTTSFNVIGEEMARRTKEESGDYVLDPFLVRTNSTETIEKDATKFEISVDPGKAFVQGHRVETLTNFSVEVEKGLDTKTVHNEIPLNYGNYFIVNELAGSFNFGVGDIVHIYNAAKQYLTNYDAAESTSAITAPSGTVIWKARVRSLQLIRGEAGTPGAQYRLYVWDLTPNAPLAFFGPLRFSAKSIYCPSGPKGICDIVLEGPNNNWAILHGTDSNSLVFPSGERALKSIDNLAYTYRTEKNDGTVKLSTGGTISVNLTAPGETFNYDGTTLNDLEKLSLIVSPQTTVTCANVTNGVSSISLNGAIVNGSGTTFTTDFTEGDYIRVSTAAGAWANVGRIKEIRSDTVMECATDIEGGATITTANVALCFPRYVPIPLYLRDERTVTLSSANTVLNINLGNTVSSDADVTIAYEAKTTGATVTKTITRKAFVRIGITTQNKEGPWNLGVTDVVRLRAVHRRLSTDATPSGVNLDDPNAKTNFYIDHRQYKNSYGTSQLHKVKGYNLNNGDYLLVQFDALVHSGPGVKHISSYPIRDDLSLNENVNAIHTLEIPELLTNQGKYYDLRDSLDFRPRTQNTANIITDINSADITTDPAAISYDNRYDLTTEKKFPVPGSICTFDSTKYLGRIDSIYMTKSGDFKVNKGNPSENPQAKPRKNEALFLNNIFIDPYPSVPKARLPQISQYINGRSYSSGNRLFNRLRNFRAYVGDDTRRPDEVQPRGYTMAQIGGLERRIADLEYYTALSFTENEVNALQIPGTGGNNRFKFGFFVDNFTTDNYFNWEDAKCRSQIHMFRLKPKKKQLRIKYKFNYNDQTTGRLVQNGKLQFENEVVTIANQPIACESDTLFVRTTQVTTRTDTQVIESQRTVVREVKRTEYFQRQENYQVSVPYVKNTGNVSLGRKEYGDSGYGSPVVIHSFTVGKLPGNIYGYWVTKGQTMALQRNIGGTWTYVCSGQHNTQYISYANGNSWWRQINYPHTNRTNSSGGIIDRQYRWVVPPKSFPGDSGKCGTFVSGYYPTTSDAVRYETRTRTVTDSRQVTDEVTEVLEDSELVSTKTQDIVDPLFNSNRTALVELDNLFDSVDTLKSPFIDLIGYIRSDLDDNPDPTVYTDSRTSEDLPDIVTV